MKTHKIYIQAPDDMSGQDVVMAAQSMLSMAHYSCQEGVNFAESETERDDWKSKMAIYDQMAVVEECPELYKHIWVQTGDKEYRWLGSIPLDEEGNPMDALYGVIKYLEELELGPAPCIDVCRLLANTDETLNYLGILRFVMAVDSTPEEPEDVP